MKNKLRVLCFSVVAILVIAHSFYKKMSVFNYEKKAFSSDVKVVNVVMDCTKDQGELLSYSAYVTEQGLDEINLSKLIMALRFQAVNFEKGRLASIMGYVTYRETAGIKYSSYSSYPPYEGPGTKRFEIEMESEGSIERYKIADESINLDGVPWQPGHVINERINTLVNVAEVLRNNCE